MKDLVNVPRIDGVFPRVTPQNDLTPGGKEGTPLHIQYVTDIFSALQSVLNAASLTPSGVAETCGTVAGDATGSQIVEALQLLAGVPGEIVGYPSDTIPAGARLLKCSGSLASRTHLVSSGKYSRLLNVWCGAPNNPTAPSFYRTSDAGGTTRNAAGNYLVLPDLRGMFLRGRDAAAGVDPDGATREFGDSQDDAIHTHIHNQLYAGATEMKEYVDRFITFGGGAGTTVHSSGVSSCTTGAASAAPTASETRPINSILMWCIRY